MEKNLRKNVYMYTHINRYIRTCTYMSQNHFAVYLKLTHYKSIALQFKKKIIQIYAYICITESLCCISETNKTLQITYTSIEKKKRILRSMSYVCHV